MKLNSVQDVIYYTLWNNCNDRVRPQVVASVSNQVMIDCREKIDRRVFDEVWDKIFKQFKEYE